VIGPFNTLYRSVQAGKTNIDYFCKIKKTIIIKKQREMDFLKAVDIIGRDLEEAMTLLEQLGVSGPEKAEIELARSRVRSAADLVRLLPSLTAANDNKAHDAPRRAEASHKTGININPPEETRVPMAEPAKTETVIAATVVAETVNNAPAAVEPKSQEPSKGILADRFTSGSTLGEKMQTEKKEEVASSVIKGKHVSDIAAAIGINDRFYFIRELFSGDALAYGDTIKRLNAAASLGEAMKILDESTVMGSDPAAQSSFVDVVRRKFSLNV
jgi:hypothetical protein